ncbi:MAG: MBL fold metallo-hydrolase [Christensenellaceae bacterium]|jgi:L-ascorbate metabolism protein UlaG (beta-lactamase superfamily)|nr:MBL fold metallo-hydrolase [Christensenellaceae bacterium]
MKIEWLGLSSYKLTESTGLSIVMDPYKSEKSGLDFPKTTADAVTISHRQYDSSAVLNGSKGKLVIETPGFHELDGVKLSGFLSYRDSNKGKERGRNIVYKVRMDGVEICHLGDIGEELSPMLAELIGMTNILFIPIGTGNTLDPQTAKEYVDMLMPDIVIPMQSTQRGWHRSDIGSMMDEFIDMFDESDVEHVGGNTVEFDRADFDGEKTRVLIFKHRAHS